MASRVKPAAALRPRPRATRSRSAASEPARVAAICDGLEAAYPEAHCELDFKTPFQLVVATILSAQCTDKRVNLVTPGLFARFPDAKAMAKADRAELEKIVQPTGFFRNKTKSILGASKVIVEDFGGKIPRTMDELLTLPGVARKTANVVLGSAFGMNEGIAVDTHVMRLSARLGLSQHTEPVKIERDLCGKLPRERWTMLGHQIIWHGRRVCAARSPNCGACTLAPHCPSAGKA